MKVQNPIIGRARGSAGGMTFCKNYDKNVARAKAFEVSNPNTQAQQTQRNFFAALTALVMDFSDDQLRTLFPSKPKTMSRRNALSKQIAESYAIEGIEKTIDFADIDTLGNAPVMDFGVINTQIINNLIYVNISDFLQTHLNLQNNRFIAALINNTKKEISLIAQSASVGEEEIELEIPNNWNKNDEIHGIPLVTNVKNNEPPRDFGAMIIIARPPRKND